MDSLEEQIRPHTQYWDCYNDCPLEYNHTGKVVKIAETFAVDFLTWVTKKYWYNGFGYVKRDKPELEQTEITIFSVLMILYKAELRDSNFNRNVE
jgi:hypothetical protein